MSALTLGSELRNRPTRRSAEPGAFRLPMTAGRLVGMDGDEQLLRGRGHDHDAPSPGEAHDAGPGTACRFHRTGETASHDRAGGLHLDSHTPAIRVPAGIVALARRFDAPVTMLRFAPDVADLLRQYTERGRTDLTAADVRAYAAVMTRQAGVEQLRSEGATAVHDVPGRRETITPSEAAAHFSFA
ncbi:ATP-binding protein [Streptomyces cinereoruber]|uniref:ATP-binding protein n=1 Tax=Streptomyces cinereoruber TaxID=67260 RepID=UPI003637EFDC